MRHRFAILTAVALLTGSAATAQAQTGYGIIAGVSQSTLTGGGSRGATWRTTFLAGVVGVLPLTESFAIRSELHYATKGARARVAGTAAAAFELGYVQFPLLLQISSPPGARPRPNLYGGVSIAALIGCSRERRACPEDGDFTGQDIDTGLVVGGEIEAFGTAIGMRYEAGFYSINRAGLPGLALVNGVLSFTMSYMFNR